MTAWPPAPSSRTRAGRRAPWTRATARSRWLLLVAAVVPAALAAWFFVLYRSDPMSAWFVGVVLLSTLMITTVWRQQRKAEAHGTMARWAQSVGWRFLRDSRAPRQDGETLPAAVARLRQPQRPSVADRWHLPPFGMGTLATVESAYHGTFRGRPAVSFEYATSGGAPLAATQLRYHVVSLALPRTLPTVWVRPRFLEPPAVAGAHEVLVESAAFNDAWRVTAEDPRFGHAVLTPTVIDRLLRPDAEGFEWRIEGATIVHWRLGGAEPAATVRALEVLSDVLDALPAFVRQGGPAAGR